MATLDINGKPIRVGCTVRRAAWGSDVIPARRRNHLPPAQVHAIGRTGTPFEGLITTDAGTGGRTWERSKNYELVQR